MKKYFIIAVLFIFSCALIGCKPEKKYIDRSEATEMFARICKLTKDYTQKVADSPDSLKWANLCSEYEYKLDKISFSYPPDTDLLLTEGQNDTIHSLMLDYIKARDGRIHEILHPVVYLDSLIDADSSKVSEADELIRSNASRNPGN